MAGMFYTIAEVAGKLSKSENEVKEMVKSGQLREFRDGAKLLFKKDEVDALTADAAEISDDTMLADDTNVGSTMGIVEDSEEMDFGLDSIGDDNPEADEDFDLDLDLSLDEEEQAELNVDLDMDENPIEAAAETNIEESIEALNDDAEFDFMDESEDELELADKTEQEAESVDDLTLQEEPQEEEPVGLSEEDIALAEGLSPDANAESDMEFDLGQESDVIEAPAENLDAIGIGNDSEFDLDLADSSEQIDNVDLASSDIDFDINDDGTKLGQEGTSVLDESDQGYDLAADPLGETAEVKLKDEGDFGGFDDEAIIEEDVNLESFGSGSGLLDLSLQADDTSLGAVLDDIIPGAGGGFDLEAGADDMLSEAEDVDEISSGDTDMNMEAMPAQPEAVSSTSRAVAAMTYAAPPADAASNAFGASLIIPLVALIYMGIVVSAAIANVAVGALTAIQDMIWYVMGGMLVVSLIVIGVGVMSSQSGSPKPATAKAAKTAKPVKVKAKKAPKPKKAKKAKK